MFTRASVHCAERIVAIRSSNGFECSKAAMCVRISLFEPLDYLSGALFFVGDHGAKAKKERGKMQIRDGLGRI